VTTQLASEQAEMIRAGRLQPLAVLAADPLDLAGHGEIPSITEWVPEIAVANNYFGIWAPADVPDEVFETMDQIWEDVIADSEALREYAADRGAFFDPSYGDEAQEAARPILRQNVWLLFDAGQAPIDPSEFGIERP
jgi:tripartite-type tricarboxylate transporter receptor subunit TctC